MENAEWRVKSTAAWMSMSWYRRKGRTASAVGAMKSAYRRKAPTRPTRAIPSCLPAPQQFATRHAAEVAAFGAGYALVDRLLGPAE